MKAKVTMKTGIELIAEERQRQIEVEGWTKEHDAQHADDVLAVAAASYAMPEGERTCMLTQDENYIPVLWPFEAKWWKPCPQDRVRELVKAGALIAAEIDRIQNEQVNISTNTHTNMMTKEQAYDYVKSEATDTQNGLMVHITTVEKAINAVAYEDELIEKAMAGVHNCEGNCADWVQLGDAEYFIDIALGIEES